MINSHRIEPKAGAPETNLRRVRKGEAVGGNSFAKPDGLELCLACWKDWMRGDADRDLGMKTMRVLAGGGDGHGVDRFEAQQEQDRRIGEATDAMINSLTRIQIWGIHRACSLSTVWKFPNADMATTIIEAKAALTAKLKNNICTAILF